MSAFNIGDECRIRSWESMEAEFGLDQWGDIACKFSFTAEMKYLCGKKFTVSRITEIFKYHSREGIESGAHNGRDYLISADMLELTREAPVFESATFESLLDYFSNEV